MPRRNGYAYFSDCGTYRYELGGDVDPQDALFRPTDIRMILWLMLNPSKANAIKGDNTVDLIVQFSELWGFNRVMVGNLYAYCATDPKDMEQAHLAGADVVGPDNDAALGGMVDRVRNSNGRIMVAWGAGPKPARMRALHAERVATVQRIAGEVLCLKTNQDGSPVHPLYQRLDTRPQIWRGMPS